MFTSFIFVVYVSHAWSCLFQDMIDALNEHFGIESDIYIWVNVFSGANPCLFRYLDVDWLRGIKRTVNSIGHFVVVLSPWRSADALKRSWQLFDIYCAEISHTKFDCIMTKADKQKFIEALYTNFESIQHLFSSLVDIRNSLVSRRAEKEKILDYSAKTKGHDYFNSRIHNNLRTWLIHRIRKAIGEIDNIEHNIQVRLTLGTLSLSLSLSVFVSRFISLMLSITTQLPLLTYYHLFI